MNTRAPKSYADVLDEWASWNANMSDQMPKFKTVQEYAKFMDGREGGEYRKSAYDPGVLQELNRNIMNIISVPVRVANLDVHGTGPDFADVGAGFGAVAEDWLNAGLPTAPITKQTNVGQDVNLYGAGMTPEFAKLLAEPRQAPVKPGEGLEEVGASMPRAIAQTALMGAGPVGLAAGLADASLAAWAPNEDPVAAVVAPATMLAGMKVIPAAGRLGEQAAARAFEPSFGDLLQAPSAGAAKAVLPGTFEHTAASMVSPNRLAENAISVGRISSELAAGTAVNEASRIGAGYTNYALGRTDQKPELVDPNSLAASVVQSLAFAPVDVMTRRAPSEVRQESALAKLREADSARLKRNELAAGRGARIAETHRKIIDAARSGADPTELVNQLRSHYIEADAERQPTVRQAGEVLLATADDANAGRFNDLDLYNILAAVQGKFDAMVSSGQDVPSGAAIGEMVKSGVLPRVSNETINNILSSAAAHSLGDTPVERAMIVNQLVEHYRSLAPEAIEQYRKLPRQEGLAKTTLDAQVEADKDAEYMSAIVSLLPHMRGKKAPDGSALDEALLARDTELSSATQGGQLNSEHTAWARYDGWKDNIIRLAKTYDPVTRTGEFRPLRRMADGKVIEGSATRMSIEDLVDYRPSGGKKDYVVKPTAKRSLEQSVSADTPVDNLLEFLSSHETTGDENQDVQMLRDPSQADKFKQSRRAETGEDEVSAVSDDEVSAVVDEEGGETLSPEDRALLEKRVKEELITADQPAVDVNKPGAGDAALWIAKKFQDGNNDDLWARYGGDKVFGKGALSPGKRELFREAVLAKMEMDVTGKDTSTITATQRSFYEKWREFANAKEGAAVEPLADSWEKQREQLRHSLRLYWRQVGELAPGSSKSQDFFLSLLDDNPALQAALRAKSARPSGSVSESYGRDESPLGSDMRTFRGGQSDPQADALRLFRGYARRIGLSDVDADTYGRLAAAMQMAFGENLVTGRLISPERAQGVNMQPVKEGDRAWVGINFDAIDAHEKVDMARLVRGLQVYAHELTHNYTAVPPGQLPTPYRQQRIEAYNKLRALFNNLGTDATYDLLNNVLTDVFFPPAFKPKASTSLTYPGAQFDAEAVSKLMEYVVLGAMTKSRPEQAGTRKGSNTADEAFLWLPNEVQAFTRLAFRDVLDHVNGLQDYYKKVDYRGTSLEGVNTDKAAALLRPMAEFSQQFLDGAGRMSQMYEAQAKLLAARMTALGSAEWDDPVIVRTTRDLDYKQIQELGRRDKLSYTVPEGEDPFGMQELQQELFPARNSAKRKGFAFEHQQRFGTQIPAWSHWFGQFYQAMNRYQKAGVGGIAESAMRLVNGLEPSYWRIAQDLHGPFTIRNAKGDIVIDPQHPVQRLLRRELPDTDKAWRALEELRMWGNEEQAPIVERGSDGKVTVAKGAEKVVAEKLAGLSAAAQQGVLEGIAGLYESYARAGEMQYSAHREYVGGQLAKFFMLKDKGLYWDQAFRAGQQAIEGAVGLERARQSVAQVQEAIKTYQEKQKSQPMLQGVDPKAMELQTALAQAQQQLAQAQAAYGQSIAHLNVDQVGALEAYAFGPSGVAGGLVQMQNMFNSRNGWFISESRPGRYMIFGKTPDGKPYATSEKSEFAAKRKYAELEKAGYQDLAAVDRAHKDNPRLFDAPDEVVNSYIKIEQEAYQKFLESIRGKVDDAAWQALQENEYTPGAASERLLANKSIQRYLLKRNLVAGREDLDSFQVLTDYTRKLAGTVARRSVRQQIELLLRDPRVEKNGEFRDAVREAVDALMEPVSEHFTKTRAAMTAGMLGLPNIVSPLVEATQAPATVLPELTALAGFRGGVQYLTGAYKSAFQQYASRGSLEQRRLIASADRKIADGNERAMTKEESQAKYYQLARDDGRFKHGVAQHAMLEKDAAGLSQWSTGMGLKRSDATGNMAYDAAGLAGDWLYWASQKAMTLYSATSSLNQQVAFMAAHDMFYDRGFRGNELYEKAAAFKDRSTFGGGKANEVGFVNKLAVGPRWRSAFSVIMPLQRYSYGAMTQWKDFAADVLGRTNLTPKQRANAAKAMGEALAVQVALAGAMGIPGAMLAAGALQYLDIDVKGTARKLWFDLAKRLGADDPLAVKVANVAQNGVGGQFLGVDLSSRFAVNSFLGFDAFEGWNTNQLLGLPAAYAERMVNAGKMVKDGKGVQAAVNLLPPSFSPMVDSYNQMKDYGSVAVRSGTGTKLADMSPAQQLKYAAGFRPYSARLFRDQQKSIDIANRAYSATAGQKVDSAALALNQGSPQPAFAWVQDYLKANPSANPQDAMKSVVDRALVQTQAQDLLASVPVGNEKSVQEIARTFGDAAPRRSEVDLLVNREVLNAKTSYVGGKPMDAAGVTRAVIVDALLSKDPTLPRAEAARLAELMGY